ncbi:MAG: hypothetical protein ACFB4J_07540 [Elainellaceae cyanobacterium]
MTSESASNIAIRSVEPSGQPGHYLVSGEATLLNDATLTITAVRNLTSEDSAPTPIYSLLDRQFAPVANGEWRATLQIWQWDGLASPQELWQIDQALLETTFTPSSEVAFIATLDPVGARDPENRLAQGGTPDIAQQTAAGDKYLAARSVLTIPAPAQIAAEELKRANIARYVGDRESPPSIVPSQDLAGQLGQSAAASRTTMPLSSRQYLQ